MRDYAKQTCKYSVTSISEYKEKEALTQNVNKASSASSRVMLDSIDLTF